MQPFSLHRKHASILAHAIIVFSLAIAPPVFAATFNPSGNCGATSIDTALGCIPTEPGNFTPNLFKFASGIAGAIALVVMLMGTIQIMTGGGNPEQVKKGKELFTGAVTGLLFVIFAVVLLRIVAGGIIQIPGF